MLLNTVYSITREAACAAYRLVLTFDDKGCQRSLVVHRGVEPRFSEPKSGVIPIYEWTGAPLAERLFLKSGKVTVFLEC